MAEAAELVIQDLHVSVEGREILKGVNLTIPTGDTVGVGNVGHSTLVQPFVGFIYNWDRFFAQGFSSLIVPTDDQEPTLFANSVCVGWKAYQAEGSSFLKALTPVLEGHLTNPLNFRGTSGGARGVSQFGALPGGVGFPDVFVVTTGLHLGIYDRTNLTTGIAIPMTGPNIYSYEVLVQLNVRF